jgi:hypothetical protein
MAETRLPDEVRALVQNYLGSMAHLDALLLLAASTEAGVPATVVASAIRVEPDAASRTLRDLVSASLVAEDGLGGIPRYRFAPGNDELRRAAETLSDMYLRFPVQVIRAVYERPSTAVQQLADAFKLRK